jgi:pSer/pThr/pTyr-binding forkhead associated (FHA) protein
MASPRRSPPPPPSARRQGGARADRHQDDPPAPPVAGDDDEGWTAPPSEEYGAPSSGSYAPDEEEPQGRSEELGRAPVEATRMAPSGEYTADHHDEPGMDPEDNPEATRAGPPVMLEITQGQDRGRRKRFAGVRLVIGRAAGCDLELSDQSVSRRHVELVYSEKGVVLRDLGSGNGTRVNGERVTERLLVHDDEIALGQTRLRFVDEQERLRRLREEADREEQERKAREQAAAAPAPAPEGEGAPPAESSPDKPEAAPGGEQPPPEEEKKAAAVVPPKKPDRRKRKQIAFAVGGALALVLLLGVGVLWAVTGPSPAEQRYVEAVVLLDQARAAAKAGDFAKAIKLAAEAERLSPGVDKDKIGERAEADLALMNGLESVRALLAEGNLELAREQLDKLPRGHEPIAVEARKKVLSELVSKELAALVALIEQRLRNREVEGLELLISKLPTNQQLRLLVELERVKRELEEEARRRALEEAARVKDARRLAELRRQAAIAEAFRNVERRFHEGDYARSVLECDRVIDAQPRDREMRERARRLKRLIPSFEQVWVDAQRKVAANSLEAAVRPLRSSLELYKQIGFQGMIRGQIESQLVRALVVAGKEADKRNELVTAAARYREALSLRSGEAEAQTGLFRLQGRVESVFMEASKLEQTSPKQATEKYQIVFQVAEPGSDLRLKAEDQLKKLRQ